METWDQYEKYTRIYTYEMRVYEKVTFYKIQGI